jgi:serine protease AprX
MRRKKTWLGAALLVLFALAGATAAQAATISGSSLVTVYPGRDAAPNAWNANATGKGVGIALVDSGVTPGPDFGTRLVQVRLDGQVGSLDDVVGHGTLVAGVAAGRSADGRFIGVAPEATIYALNVYRPEGTRTGDVVTALKWVYDNAHLYNIRVVNLSLAENVTGSYTSSDLDLAVERLWAEGVLVVVSAGNHGAGQIDYAPANDPLALTVGAFDDLGTTGPGDDILTTFSSGGLTVDGYSKPELLAPGRHVASDLPAGSLLAAQAPLANLVSPGYARISGTSFSAPQVAGAAAIAFQTHPGYSPDQVKWLLLAKAGAKPRASNIGTLDLSAVYNFASKPSAANQGVRALVCAPGSSCLTGGAVASSWNSNSWTSNSWTSNSWTNATWNSNSWTTGGWSSAGWTSNSWTSIAWNATSWDAVVWD